MRDPRLRRIAQGSGIAQIDLFENVQVAEPPPDTLYTAVKVVLPELSGVAEPRTDDALARCREDPPRTVAFASEPENVFAPLAENDMKHDVELELPMAADVTVTRTLPEAGTVRVTAGPAVVRLV